ncbi:MAG TPA: hypothetical protein VHF01_14195 [Candidatus Acidoferrum sp.]|nr:hypothetical protein [Candidatus Acidoferrum sp.]
MDFTGKTSMEAANRLWSFVKQAAEKSGTPLEFDVGGTPALIHELTARASGASGSSFYIQIGFEDEPFAETQRRMNPHKSAFGHGRITKRGASIMLELRRETDGIYRWYGVPVELTEQVKRVVPSIGPFVLTEEYVADGFRALSETAA